MTTFHKINPVTRLSVARQMVRNSENNIVYNIVTTLILSPQCTNGLVEMQNAKKKD